MNFVGVVWEQGGGNERTCGHQDTTLAPIAAWAADGEITGKLGTRDAEVDVGLPQRLGMYCEMD